MNPKLTLIWDLPTRLFHWLLTAGFIAAAMIALLTEGDGSLFPWHAIIGLALALMVVLRVMWGFFGTRHARFTSFLFGPGAVIAYLKEAFGGGGKRHIGHNPGSAYAIFAMLALVLGISISGIMLSLGYKDLKEAHELMTYSMIAVVVAHVAGVIFHSIRHRENITMSMISGKKDCDSSFAIASARPMVAALVLLMLGTWTYGLVKNYSASAKTTTIPLLGTSLQLGENERGENRGDQPGVNVRKHGGD